MVGGTAGALEPGLAYPAARVKVKCFRGINSASVLLSPITILTGRNNSGKSSLLEAVTIGFSAFGGFRDWLGNNVVRTVIDGKLSGRPIWLIRESERCDRAEIVVDAAQGRARVELRKPGNGAAKKLACRIVASLDARRLAGCFTAALLSKNVDISDIGQKLLEIDMLASKLVKALRKSCSTGNAGRQASIDEYMLLSDILMQALQETAQKITAMSVEVKARLPVCTPSRRKSKNNTYYSIYYPNILFLISNRDKYVGPALEAAASEFVGSMLTHVFKEIGSDPTKELLADCIARLLEAALLDALKKYNETAKMHEGGSVRVFAIFHRLIVGGYGGLADALTNTIRGLHRLGLLNEYNNILNIVEDLGLADPFIEEGMVWFRRTSGEGERVAASLLGDGVLHLLLLLAGLAVARGGNAVVVYEEPETGLHPGYMSLFAELLVEAAASRRDTYVVLSTHNLELIRYVVEAAAKRGASELLTTVLMHEGDIYSVFHGREVVEAAELEVDLRGL